jgi:hypothetical protein
MDPLAALTLAKVIRRLTGPSAAFRMTSFMNPFGTT